MALSTTRSWLLGFISGVAALIVTDVMFVLGVALVALTAMLRPRPAAAAGVCVAWGGGFLFVLRQAAERCAEFDRRPNAGCTMGDNSPFLIVGLAVLALGVVLTLYAVVRARSSRIPS
jgi:hypothetical protein